jgi:hypothetical protein
MTFTFTTDEQSESFCRAIVDGMIELFGITEDEAIGRVNRQWNGMVLIGDELAIYHEDEDYWASAIYFGKNSRWWNNPPDLKPRPVTVTREHLCCAKKCAAQKNSTHTISEVKRWRPGIPGGLLNSESKRPMDGFQEGHCRHDAYAGASIYARSGTGRHRLRHARWCNPLGTTNGYEWYRGAPSMVEDEWMGHNRV